MTANAQSASISRLLTGTASIVIILAGMRVAATIVNAILLAWIVAVSVTPLLNWLIRKGLPERLAQLIIVILVVAACFALTAVLGVSVSQLADTFPTYRANLVRLERDLASWAADMGIDLTEILALEAFDAERLVEAFSKIALQVSGAVTVGVMTLTIAVFMLLEVTRYPHKLERALRSDSTVPGRIYKVNREIRQYMVIMTWAGLVVAITNAVLLLVIGVDYAVLWGLLSLLMSYVPTIGFIISVIPPATLALLKFGWQEALVVLLGYGVIKSLVFSVLKPRFAAQRLDISRVVIIVSVIFSVWLLGPVGSILSVPLAVMVKDIILESSDDTRPLAILMSAGAEVSTAQVKELSEEARKRQL